MYIHALQLPSHSRAGRPHAAISLSDNDACMHALTYRTDDLGQGLLLKLFAILQGLPRGRIHIAFLICQNLHIHLLPT